MSKDSVTETLGSVRLSVGRDALTEVILSTARSLGYSDDESYALAVLATERVLEDSQPKEDSPAIEECAKPERPTLTRIK